ncbi:hypothetical protein CDD80_405 [Ophiocordyceps camponoti-rufipedis]|uniref:Delta 8-(E)-sphingolipid desaturase n=1 Tax=Ophiocordyceps camponoti-rufipedis TaxID=2004952 RepID=A0A2C5ZDZ3_9HYPO|nr:hypothetical protein CDD80_405 [Ophiocordyceps camponoti-rufipedis]
MDRDKVLSQAAVDALIADGQTIVIFQDHVLRLDSWLSRHPGGSLAILHMIGRDATDEITVHHAAPTLRTMSAFRIGRKPPGLWTNRTPPIRQGPLPVLEPALSDDSLPDDDTNSSPSTAPTSPPTSSYGDDKVDEHQLRRRKGRDVVTTVLDDPASVIDAAVQSRLDRDVRDYPSVDPAVQQDIVAKYRQLHQKIIDEGLYDCPYREVAKDLVRFLILFSAFMVALRYEWYLTSSFFLGLFWHQIMFTAHDAGHRAITHNFVVDTLIGMFIADFCCGLSIGWWKSSHNVHHLITNQPEHDPDIQNVPLFATCPSFFKSITSTYYPNFVIVWDAAADLLVPYQKYTYYPVLAIARFNLYILSWLHVLSSKSSSLAGTKAWWIRPGEISFMCCYWFLFGYCLLWRSLPTWTARVVYTLVSHIVTMPLHVQINLSHWGMSTSDLGPSESFPQRQLRATMDVDCPTWLDFYHGGLQFQAVHHLFPRLPRHNLRKAQAFVKEFCQSTGIPYTILTFTDGNRKVLGRLQEVTDQLAVLAKCQKSLAESGTYDLH